MNFAPNTDHPATTQQLAFSTLEELHRAAFAHEAGAAAGDAEAIHDMRVLVRRMRVALSNFACCFAQYGRKLVRARLSDLADDLGAVRDFDVFIAALEARRSKLTPDQQTHLRDLIGRLRARRRRRQKQLVAYLQSEEYQQLKNEFFTLLQSPNALTPDGAAIQEAHGQTA